VTNQKICLLHLPKVLAGKNLNGSEKICGRRSDLIFAIIKQLADFPINLTWETVKKFTKNKKNANKKVLS
jgi:hypothetical protein